MKIEDMESKHSEELKIHLSTYDTVIDIQMVGYLDMYGDGSRNYVVYLYDTLAECFVLSNFEYYITQKRWMLSDMKRFDKTGKEIPKQKPKKWKHKNENDSM